MLKSSILACAILGFAGLALASSGGGERKKKDENHSIILNPYKKFSGFSLKAGRMYEPALSLHKTSPTIDIRKNPILTLRKGNTIFILPAFRNGIPGLQGKSNLNALQFNIQLHH